MTFVSAAIIASAYTAAAMMARHYFAIDVELRRLRDIVILILTGLGGAFVFAILLPLLLSSPVNSTSTISFPQF